ncbi:cation:proton antiporter [Aeromicrobium choanae]|uniref:Transporter, CPA2 family n=1 Tax=Aeromicrobium choanae TaxID=1736691 RepID=A0A1T4YY99_9ACTN|nr:cation:proton antiporter [Aeromicrobium choanae]SKB06281.1 transporter, CPA2 family [Aeromicrobium choanae]
MEQEAATSLFWISLAMVIAPLLAGLVRGRVVPEVVLLLGLGLVIGPFALDLAGIDPAIGMLRELGLGLLFLLAGYEIDVSELTGGAGRRALFTWCICLALAFGAVALLLGDRGSGEKDIALAIALTSTALGTLLPILRDGGLLSSRVGASVLRHGAFGELGPIVAIAVALGTRGSLASLVVLIVFVAIVGLLAVLVRRLRGGGSHLRAALQEGAETTSQLPIRLTMLLLVSLGAVAVTFELDIVLAAFAAGFLLRFAIPDGWELIEHKLDGIAYGFLIPIFFVTSGMAIDPGAIVEAPATFLTVIVLILLVRGIPVYLASRFTGPARERFGNRDALSIGFYAATGLPIIVAVTSVAVDQDLMSSADASLLVAAGAVTVLVCPLLARAVAPRATVPDEEGR